ncbi:hypothetical protein [Planctomicrobium sp. SH527]|uniref:hypothetical protein n=1 Tax=Planctomicrobium sp. SH527 TaxID=3448123 RepID=UPI003F5BA882
MVAQRTLTIGLQQQLQAHLQDESQVIKRVEALASALGSMGPTGSELVAQQSEILLLIDDALHIQQQRQHIREAIAADWNCLPEDVRLGVITLESPEANLQFQTLRNELIQATARAGACLKTTREQLTGLHGIVTDLLASIMPSGNGDHVRYTAAGQRLTPVMQPGIEIRS